MTPLDEAREAFDPKSHMAEPFTAFMKAAEHCGKMGWLVIIRPDCSSGWEQQLFIFPADAAINARAALAEQDNRGD